MKRPKSDNAAVTTFADHEVIMPPNKLKKAVVRKRRNDPPEEDPVVRAEAALGALSNEFSQWMDNECERLDGARRAVIDNGFTEQSRDELFRAAHDIKGEAATFGFPLVGPVAESLCRLIEHSPELARVPLMLIDQHVDAIRAIVRKDARTNAERTAERLAERLRQVTDEFLAHENRHRPEYLDGILAPPLAPGDATA